MIDPFEQIRELANNGISQWQEVIKMLNSISTDFSQISPHLGESLDDFGNRVTFMYSFLKSVQANNNTSSYLIPTQTIASLNANLQNGNAQIAQIQSMLQQIPSYGGFRQFDYANLYIYGVNGQAINLQPYYANLKAYLDSSSSLISSVQSFLKIKGSLDFSSATSEYNEAYTKIRGLVDESQGVLNEINLKISEINSKSSIIDALSVKSQSDSQKISTTQLEMDVKLKEAENTISSIGSVNLEAIDISSRISKIKPNLISFDSTIADYDKKVSGLINLNTEAELKNHNREKIIDAITQKADTMLKGATVAGLAQSFDETFKSYRKQAGAAMWVFYFSILLLAGATVPNILYLIKSADQNHLIDFPGILARFIIAPPALIFVWFTSRRYSALFALQREYAHRSTIAKAVDGFKREAPNYEQEIAHAVFITLQENPAVRHHKSEKDDDDKFQGILEKIFDTLKSNTPGSLLSNITGAKDK
jgi:hypothetical protein